MKKEKEQPSGSNAELLRIGIIGFGTKAKALTNGLGYMHPRDAESRKANGSMDDWLAQEDLNVAITGICDVFDLHAEKGLSTVREGVRAGGAHSDLPVKRFRSYQEMLDDKDIDAVMIVTPDHHHAPISIAGAKAGKHIYCEKSPAITEKQLYEPPYSSRSENLYYFLLPGEPKIL